MKRVLPIILSIVLILSLTACGTGSSSQDSGSQTDDTSASASQSVTSQEESNEAQPAESSAPQEAQPADTEPAASEEPQEAQEPTPAEPETTQTEEPASAETETDLIELPAETQSMINDTLQAIYDVRPGTAGSSLRAMSAAGKLLDLSEALTDQVDASALAQVVYTWTQANDEIEGAFDEAYANVREIAFDYITNPSEYSGQLSDCGYEMAHDSYTQSYLEYVCNYIEIARSPAE